MIALLLFGTAINVVKWISGDPHGLIFPVIMVLSGLSVWGLAHGLLRAIFPVLEKTLTSLIEGDPGAGPQLRNNAISLSVMFSATLVFFAAMLLRWLVPLMQESLVDYNGMLLAYCAGACIVTVFMRVAASFFAKTADISADLGGRFDFNLLDDDLRNPSVIADLAGDLLNNLVANALLVFESVIFLLALATISTVSAHSGLLMSNVTFQPLVVIFLGVIISLVLSAGVWIPKINVPRLSTLLLFAYLTMSAAAVIFFFRDIIWAQTAIQVVIGSVIGGLVVASHRSQFFSWSPGILKYRDDAQLGSVGVLLSGLKKGALLSLLPLTLITFVWWIMVKFTSFFSMSEGVLGVAHSISMIALTCVAPLPLLFSLGISTALADTVKGCAHILNLDATTTATVNAWDRDASGGAVLMKGLVSLVSILGASLLPILVINRLAELVYGPIHEQSLSGIDPLFLMGCIGAAICAGAIITVIAYAMKHGITVTIKQIRAQMASIEGIATGAQLPDYAAIVSGIDVLSRRYAALLLTFVVSMCVALSALGGRHVVIGLLTGMIAFSAVISFVALYCGSVWHTLKKTVEDEGPDYFQRPDYSALVVADAIGDVSKDVVMPIFISVIKLLGISILLLSCSLI
jgi:Na+/H+-translocating membrane pyrophosphatase